MARDRSGPPRTQEYYDRIKDRFARERDLRLGYRPEGTAQFTSELSGALAKYAIDPYVSEPDPREPLHDTVECLFIGGGFSALLTSARLREYGVDSIRIVERVDQLGRDRVQPRGAVQRQRGDALIGLVEHGVHAGILP